MLFSSVWNVIWESKNTNEFHLAKHINFHDFFCARVRAHCNPQISPKLLVTHWSLSSPQCFTLCDLLFFFLNTLCFYSYLTIQYSHTFSHSTLFNSHSCLLPTNSSLLRLHRSLFIPHFWLLTASYSLLFIFHCSFLLISTGHFSLLVSQPLTTDCSLLHISYWSLLTFLSFLFSFCYSRFTAHSSFHTYNMPLLIGHSKLLIPKSPLFLLVTASQLSFFIFHSTFFTAYF